MYPRASDLMDSSVYSNPNSPDPSFSTLSETRPSQQGASSTVRPSQQGASSTVLVPQPFFQSQYFPPTQYTPELSDLDSEQGGYDINITRGKTTHLPRDIEMRSTTQEVGNYPGSFPDDIQDLPGPIFNTNLNLKPSKRTPEKPASAIPAPTIPSPNPSDEPKYQTNKQSTLISSTNPVTVGPAPAHPGHPSQTSFSTPVKQRLSTSRPPDDERRLKAEELIPLLRKELASDMDISQTSTFVDLLFPSSRLPIPINDATLDALAKEGFWNTEDARFITRFQNYKEGSIAKWLNVVGRLIGKGHNKKRIRLWYAGTCTRSPEGSQHLRKPDIVLLDRAVYESEIQDGERVHWRMIRAFAEVTAQTPFPKRILETVNEKSYLLFLTQDDRRFVPALSFDGSGCFSLTITDRQGQIRLAPMALFAPGKDVALVLLKILAYFMYAPLADIGLDPSMLCDETGKIQAILVSSQKFTVVKRIYSLQALIGRGTKIWVVRRGDNHYILKDSWVVAGRVESEIDFLDKFAEYSELRGSVPALIQGEDLMINGELDSTERYRLHIGQINRHRVHRRHVTQPIGTPIVSFASKAEFLSVIIDAVRILQTLHDIVGVLHRDISPNNILFVYDSTGKARCLLIDFDYAVTVGKMQQASHGFRTGTPPFMALEIMLQSGKNFRHELRHDLESLLYVVFWVCSHMTAPGVENGKLPHVRGWCNMALRLQELGHLKLAHIVDAERIILADFTPYWGDFKPFARQLLAAFFPLSPAAPNEITPDIMLTILDEALSVVEEPPSRFRRSDRLKEPRSVQVYATLAGIKRDRQGQDAVVVSKRVKQSNATVTRLVPTINQLESIGPDADQPSTPFRSTSSIFSIDSVCQ